MHVESSGCKRELSTTGNSDCTGGTTALVLRMTRARRASRSQQVMTQLKPIVAVLAGRLAESEAIRSVKCLARLAVCCTLTTAR